MDKIYTINGGPQALTMSEALHQHHGTIKFNTITMTLSKLQLLEKPSVILPHWSGKHQQK